MKLPQTYTVFMISIMMLFLSACQLESDDSSTNNSSSGTTPDSSFARYDVTSGAFIGCLEITGNNVVSYNSSLVKDGEGSFVKNGISNDVSYTSGTKSGISRKVNHRIIFSNNDRYTVVSNAGTVVSREYRVSISSCSNQSNAVITIPTGYVAIYSQADNTIRACLELDFVNASVTRYNTDNSTVTGNVTSYPEYNTTLFSDGSSFQVQRTSGFIAGVWKVNSTNTITNAVANQYRTTVSSCSPMPASTITIPAGL